MSIRVKFISKMDIDRSTTALEAAKAAKIKIKDSCDGKGKCGKCLIKIKEGTVSKPTKQEKKLLGEDKIEKGYRLACKVEIEDDAIIEVIHK